MQADTNGRVLCAASVHFTVSCGRFVRTPFLSITPPVLGRQPRPTLGMRPGRGLCRSAGHKPAAHTISLIQACTSDHAQDPPTGDH
jgi:hypothetical protein